MRDDRNIHIRTCFEPVYSVYLPNNHPFGKIALHQDNTGMVWADFGGCAFPRPEIKNALKYAHAMEARVK